MGDSGSDSLVEDVVEKAPEPQESVTNALRPAKPSENIAISEATPLPSEEELHDTAESAESNHADLAQPPEPQKVAQPTEMLPTEVPQVSVGDDVDVPAPVVLEKKLEPAVPGPKHSERLLRNQSDIFSLKEQTSSVSSSIFSINGSPSRKVTRKREPIPFGGQPTEPPPNVGMRGRESYSDVGHPTNSARNPLTGTGLSSNDEYKFKSGKRKDGNPLLGLGYDPEVVPSGHRIPPGGFSHKLW